MALTQYLQRSREFGRGHRSASRARDPSVSPQLRVCIHWGPPQTVPLSLISLGACCHEQSLDSFPTPLICPRMFQQEPRGAAGHAQLPPPPRDSQRHRLLGTERTIGLGEEVLGPGRKILVKGGRFESGKDLNLGSLGRKTPQVQSLGSQCWCWGTGGSHPHAPVSPCPPQPQPPVPTWSTPACRCR